MAQTLHPDAVADGLRAQAIILIAQITRRRPHVRAAAARATAALSPLLRPTLAPAGPA